MYLQEDMNYLVYQKETCPTTLKSHWQGYVEMKKKITMGGLKKKVSANAHWEIAKGSADQNKAYCHKDQEGASDKAEFGVPMAQGERTDLEGIAQSIKEGAKVNDLAEMNPQSFHTFGRTMDRLETIRMNKNVRTEMTTITWLWGRTGTGKSHMLTELIAKEGRNINEAYWHNVHDKMWWDGYYQQDDVILDDFRGEIPFQQLLRLADKYPMTVAQRNKQPMNFVSKKIWVTSSKSPEQCYAAMTGAEDRVSQLLRRIVQTEHLTYSYVGRDNDDEKYELISADAE